MPEEPPDTGEHTPGEPPPPEEPRDPDPAPGEPPPPEEPRDPDEEEAGPSPEDADAQDAAAEDELDEDAELVFLDDDADLAPVLEAAGVLEHRKSRAGLIAGCLLLLLLLLGGGGFALWWFVLREKPAPPPPAPRETEEERHERELVEHTPEMLRQRRASRRLETALRYGGTEETEKAVDSALHWFSTVAEEDGRWDARRHGSRENVDLALTGLTLLAFAGAGQTAQEGDYAETVSRARDYLISHQDPDTGVVWAKGQGGHGPGYTHAICGMALAELGALDRDEKTLAAARKAAAYAVDRHQFQKKGERGGWRYNAGEWGDTSVTGWFMMLLKVAPQAGYDVPAAALDGAVRFLESCRTAEKDPEGRRFHLYGYTNRSGVTPRRSVIGCLCRLYADASADDLLPTVDRILEERSPSWDRQDWYYWYYGMLLTFQVDHERFQTWNLALRDLIVEHQSTEKKLAGSWNPGGDYGMYGRLFSTAMAALCLEVYYRYAPRKK